MGKLAAASPCKETDLRSAAAKSVRRPSVTGGPRLTGVGLALSKTSRNRRPSRHRQKVQRAEAPAHLQVLAAIALSYL
jgi:hypothetical protein